MHFIVKLPSAVNILLRFYFHFFPVISMVVGEMVDRSDLAASHHHRPPSAAALSRDVLTVFQFHTYILEHEVQDMETHLLHLAREGQQEHKLTLQQPRLVSRSV